MKSEHRSKRRVCFLFAASSGVAARSHFLVPCASATQFSSEFKNIYILKFLGYARQLPRFSICNVLYMENCPLSLLLAGNS